MEWNAYSLYSPNWCWKSVLIRLFDGVVATTVNVNNKFRALCAYLPNLFVNQNVVMAFVCISFIYG